MTARTDDYTHEDRSITGKTVALTLLLGFVALTGSAAVIGALKPLPGFWTWARLCIAATGLVITWLAFRGLSKLAPSSMKSFTALIVLGSIAMLGLIGTKRVVIECLAAGTLWGSWDWQTAVELAKNLLIFIASVAGVVWLKPWAPQTSPWEPVSPRTRRTHKLFAVSGLVAIPGMVALIYDTSGRDRSIGMFSNSAVSPGIAIFAIASWLLGMAISWWWYVSADEHERHAYDFGMLVGGGMFLTVAPAWWIAARADLLPGPDAMILWVATMVVTTIAWAWRR